jgi:predicted dehydrogenase
MNTLRFAAIGLNHGHIAEQVRVLQAAGATLVTYYAPEPELAQKFGAAHPEARLASGIDEILEDESIALVTSAGIPNERAALGIDVMRHGKDFFSDKPGFTDWQMVAEARRAQIETGRFFTICYGRLASRSLYKACELARSGAIGRVVQTIGLGPHRIGLANRPPWFVVRSQYGGILVDLASHQFDMFLQATGARHTEVVAAQVANYHNPQHAELEDFGDVMLRSEGATGYMRVDWYTPDSLPTFGDGRFFVLGTEGYLEVRSEFDPAGRSGNEHLFLCDNKEVRYIDCKEEPETPLGRNLLNDIRDRTQTAIAQEQVFVASELALQAQSQATRLGSLAS